MNRLPSLLRNGTTKLIPEQTATDLSLAKLYSAKALSVLLRPCDGETIALRQEIFRALNRPERVNRLRTLEETLQKLKTQEEKRRKTDAKIEILFLKSGILQTVTDACDQLNACEDLGTMFQEISAELNTPERREQREAIRLAAKQSEALLASVGEFDIGAGIQACEKEVETLNQILFRCAHRMGMELPEQPSKKHALGSLEEDWFEAFEPIPQTVEEILLPFKDLYTQDLTDLADEISFYLEIHTRAEEAKRKHLSVCIPEISQQPGFTATDVYDITLLWNDHPIIPNDTWFSEEEPFFFVTGANGGGKTTYLRAVGCNLILFLAGCPIFAKQASIHPFTTILTHFPEEERFERGGRLDNERSRAYAMIATEGSPFFLFNEPFSSTDEIRGFEELQQLYRSIREQHRFGLCVTHFHQVRSLDCFILGTVVRRDENNRRTYRIERKSAESSSFAADILQKYKLDAESLRERRVNREV